MSSLGLYTFAGQVEGLLLAERVAVQLAMLIDTDIAEALRDVETAVADGLALDDPVDIITGERMARGFPALWVLVTESQREVEETFGQLGNQFPFGLYNHSVEIVVGLTDPDDPDRLRTRLYRYVRALAAVLHAYQGGVVGVADWARCRVLGHNFTRIFQHIPTNEFRQDAHVFCDVSRTD